MMVRSQDISIQREGNRPDLAHQLCVASDLADCHMDVVVALTGRVAARGRLVTTGVSECQLCSCEIEEFLARYSTNRFYF